MGKLFGLCEAAQSELIKAKCFGECGKISAARIIRTERLGPLWVCCAIACPFLRGEMDKPIGRTEETGEEVFLRSIQEERHPTPQGATDHEPPHRLL